MPSQYSQNLRIELIASGEQGNTWGNTTNNNLGTLIEQAISGYRSIDTIWSSNACTLTALNGANDQARNMFLDIPSSVLLTAEGQLVAPTVPKMYVIRNNTSGGYAIRIKTGASSTTCLIPNGATKAVVCDGTNFSEATTAAADFYIANTPTTALQATNKTYVDTADNLRLNRDGSQNMTGELELSAGTAPVKALAAVSRQYVQATFLPLTGGTLSGGLTLPSSVGGLTTWSAVPKQYVDSISVSSLNSGITVGGSIATGVTLTMNPATASNLGGIKVGSGLSVAGDGTLSATGTSGVASIAVTSPIQNTGTATNVALSMIANAYYPYSSNPAGYVTSSGSVAYADFAGSAAYADFAGSAGSAGTTTYISGATNYTWSSPTSTPSSSTYGIAFKQTVSASAALTCIMAANSATGTPLALIRTNANNTNGVAGAAVNFAFGSNVISGAGITIDSASAVSYLTGSDYRLKQNIAPISNALDRVVGVNPVQFSYIVTPDTLQEGFIAHELAPYAPYAVNGVKDEVDEEGNPVYQGVDQAKLVPLLTAAIRELNAKVIALTAEVEALKGA